MQQMNPVAVILMVFGCAVGFAVASTFGLAIGLAVTSGLVLVRSFFP